jgi:hypothetical protein
MLADANDPPFADRLIAASVPTIRQSRQTKFLRVIPVLVGVMLARLLGVMRCVIVMPRSDVRVVTGLFMVGVGVMFGRGAMMLRGVFVMFSSFQVMIGDLFRHKGPFLEF